MLETISTIVAHVPEESSTTVEEAASEPTLLGIAVILLIMSAVLTGFLTYIALMLGSIQEELRDR